MHDESQDVGARIRHVPIQVEQRNTRRSNHRQREEQTNHQGQDQNGAQYHKHRQRDPYPEFHPIFSQASPETSSINISHKPSPPARQTTHHNMNNPHSYYQPEFSYEDEGRFNNATSMQGQDKESDRSRSKHRSTDSPAPNSDKLVSSPEPIPLPPPPTEHNSGANIGSNHGENKNWSHESSMHQQHYNHTADNSHSEKDTSVFGKINMIKLKVSQLLQDITNFNGVSAKSKDYRFLDEMLTRCILDLDDIECGESADLRQQRRATIKLAEAVTDILKRRLHINKDIHDLSESMTISP